MSLRHPTVAFLLKPFMWCRLDARLWHAFYLFTFRGVASDTRPVFIYVLLGFQADYRRFPFTYLVMLIFLNVHWWINHDASMHAFVISFVRTVLRVLSKYSPGLLIWPDLMKAISWMMSLIASPAPRGVPVSPVRSWIWSLVLYTLPLPRIKVLEPHSDARRAVVFRSHITHSAVIFSTTVVIVS